MDVVRGLKIAALLLFVIILFSCLTGCALRARVQACVLRCPDLVKSPAQIIAEGQRECMTDEDNDARDCVTTDGPSPSEKDEQ